MTWNSVIDDAMDEWHKRLWVYIHAKKGILSIQDNSRAHVR